MQVLDLALKAYFELIKISIGTYKDDFDFSVLNDEQWNNVFEESKKQSTALMCFDALKFVSAKPNDEIYNSWFLTASKILSNNIHVSNQQQVLINVLNDNNIPYAILKGLSSAFYYPNGEYRNSGDIDFIVLSKDVETTKELLLKNDYSMHRDVNPVHYEFHKNGARYELHRRISGIPDNSYGKIFEKELCNIIKECVMVNNFNKPGDYHHGIIIFLHTMHHILCNGIGLRHLCDWACFVNRTIGYSFWGEQLIPLLKKTGTYKFMCGITLASVKLFDIVKPSWCNEELDEMVETIINEVISAGNFGRKKPRQPSLIMTRKDSGKNSAFSKMCAMIKALNRTNAYICPLIKKVPIIYPFLMIYRVFRYLILMCIGKKTSLIEISKFADERNAVYTKYQLYKTDK